MKTERFKTLQYDGPLFPEEYRTKGYDLAGEKLPPLAEEMLWMAARFLGSDYEKEAFHSSNKNMWKCLKPELTVNQQKLSFPNDFIPLMENMKRAAEAIKQITKESSKIDKVRVKELKEGLKEKFGYALLDGVRQPLVTYMVEAPNWIMTRGKDPRKFSWKYRVQPGDIVYNTDNKAIWVYSYKIKCGRPEMGFPALNKTVTFHGKVSLRQENITGKFDKTSDILKNWANINTAIDKGCAAGTDEAIIIYLIMQTGIRIGNERDENKQALTYGMQTLEFQHLSVLPNNEIQFDFLGKDSVPDQRIISVQPTVHAFLSKRLKALKAGERIFRPNVNVNSYLKRIQPGATVKNLRTVVCNEVLVNSLKTKKVTKANTDAEKLRAIFEANLEIAKTLNHQKNVGKNQKEGEQKIAERVKRAKERVKTIKAAHAGKVTKLDEKANKFKTLYAGTPKLLKEKLDEIKTAKAKLVTQMEKAKANIEKVELALDKKKLTKDISLGTSLANYVDFKIIKSYCDEIDLPIERIFSKAQMTVVEKQVENCPPNYWRTYPS